MNYMICRLGILYIPPCAPVNCREKTDYIEFKPISAYQEYAGIGFIYALVTGFFSWKTFCQKSSKKVKKS